MPDPFTIRIFVPDGDPEGVRLIDRDELDGGSVWRFPASNGRRSSNAPSFFARASTSSSVTRKRMTTCRRSTSDRRTGCGVGFIPMFRTKTSGIGVSCLSRRAAGLNRAHVTWLEYALVSRAVQTKRCHLDNGNAPQEPAMTEAEKADTQGFLKEILQILPLVGLRAFEFAKPIATPTATTADTPLKSHSNQP